MTDISVTKIGDSWATSGEYLVALAPESNSVNGFKDPIDDITSLVTATFIQNGAPEQTQATKPAASSKGGVIGFLDRNLATIKRVIAIKQLAEIALAPLHLISIVRTSLSFHKRTPEKKVDAGLDITSSIKQVGESTGAFVGALEELSAIPAARVAWVTPFALVMSFLSIVDIISSIRTCFKMRRLMREIKQVETVGKVDGKVTLTSYRNVLELLGKKQKEDKEFYSDYFNANETKFVQALTRIETESHSKISSDEVHDREQGQHMLENALKSLKGRLSQEIGSSTLSATASTISIIGTIVLIASPLSPVGWAILGVGALVDMTRWSHHKIVEYKFAKSISLKRTPLEWVLC